MSRTAAAWFLALALASGAPAVLAGDGAAVDRGGAVHSVATESWTQKQATGGSVLVHVVQAPDGTETREFIPGTDNFALERDPAIDIDPVTDSPVVVWVQAEGRATALYLARRDNGVWSTPRPAWADGGINLAPQLDVRTAHLHLVWQQEGDRTVRLRLTLDRDSLDPVFGPEELPVDDAGLVTPDGAAGTADSPTADLSYFASLLPPRLPGEPGRIVTWGIRDEPVPVVYFQPFQLPAGIQGVGEQGSEWLEGRFVTWFTSGSTFYYTTLADGQWDDLRIIALTDDRSTADALRLLLDQIRR